MTRWEYKIFQVELTGMIRKIDTAEVETLLNEHGAEGFELVGHYPVSGNTNHTPAMAFITKRPVK